MFLFFPFLFSRNIENNMENRVHLGFLNYYTYTITEPSFNKCKYFAYYPAEKKCVTDLIEAIFKI